jgi:hypothetical protein
MNSDMQPYLQPSPVVDCDNRAVAEFAKESAGDSSDRSERAVRLYYAVRDGIRYDPYSIDLSSEGLRASTTLQSGRGWCVAKAVLLAACCRTIGIPARIGFADVRNHLTTQRMRGRSDSIYHPLDLEGKKHMEYIAYRGEFADVPIDQIAETFRREYLVDPYWNKADFDLDVELETGKDRSDASRPQGGA